MTVVLSPLETEGLWGPSHKIQEGYPDSLGSFRILDLVRSIGTTFRTAELCLLEVG
jgi:hypothetical protein